MATYMVRVRPGALHIPLMTGKAGPRCCEHALAVVEGHRYAHQDWQLLCPLPALVTCAGKVAKSQGQFCRCTASCRTNADVMHCNTHHGLGIPHSARAGVLACSRGPGIGCSSAGCGCLAALRALLARSPPGCHGAAGRLPPGRSRCLTRLAPCMLLVHSNGDT